MWPVEILLRSFVAEQNGPVKQKQKILNYAQTAASFYLLTMLLSRLV